MLLFVITASYVFITSSRGQNWISKKLIKSLSDDLGVTLQLQKVEFSLFNKLVLKNVLLQDEQKDTLLFAGKLNFHLTDWFFIKDKVVLKYVGLENATVNISRHDSVWNFLFLQKYLTKNSTKTSNAVELDLKKLELKSITFRLKNDFTKQTAFVYLKTLLLNADEFNFKTKNIKIRSLLLQQPVLQFTQLEKKSKQKLSTTNTKDNFLSFLKKNDWKVQLEKLKIEEGVFGSGNLSSSQKKSGFDAKHLLFSAINGTVSQLQINKDTIFATINLKAKEKSGLEIKSFFADAMMNSNTLQLKDLLLQTNKSTIRQSLFLNFENEKNFLSTAKINLALSASEIHSDDIAYFVPATSGINKKINISGNFSGTLKDLTGKNIFIKACNHTAFRGSVHLKELLDVKKTWMKINVANLKSTLADLHSFFPFLPKETFKLIAPTASIGFSGIIQGNLQNFQTNGTLLSSFGNVSTNLQVKFLKETAPTFFGKIESDNFNLGGLLQDKNFGNISFQSEIKGTDLGNANFENTIETKIQQLEYNKYAYQNILLNGSISQKILSGNFSINDKNATGNWKGKINFSDSIPKNDFLAQIEKLNFKPLNFSNQDYSFKGNVNANFSGNTLDNILGKVGITKGEMSKNDKTIFFESLQLTSIVSNQKKILTINSDEFEGELKGHFSMKEFPNAATHFLAHYFPSSIVVRNNKSAPQDFEFRFKSNYIDAYINFFDSSIHGFNSSLIEGNFNSESQQSNLNISFPFVAYKNYQFQNLRINSASNFGQLNFLGMVDQIDVNDDIKIPFTKINMATQNDFSKLSLQTQSTNKNIPSGSIQTMIQSFNDGIAISFDSSQFVVNGKIWTIEKNGKLELRSNSNVQSEITLKESNQEINIRTKPSTTGSWNDILISLKKINMGDLIPYFTKSNSIEGLVSGSVSIEDPLQKFKVSGNVQTDELRFETDSIGQVKSNFEYNGSTGQLIATGKNLNEKEKIGFAIRLNIKDSVLKKENSISIETENYPIKIVEQFIGNLFTDLQGYATGNLKIVGSGRNQKYIGTLRTHDAGLKVLFTQCSYKILDTDIRFTEDMLDLGTMKLIDPITQNTATLSKGIIKHNSWRNMDYDIRLQVDNRPMQLLNTTVQDNQDFFGNAKGTGSFSFTGLESDLLLKVAATASSRDSSYVTIPNIQQRKNSVADFLVEKKYGREIIDSVSKSSGTKLKYDIVVTGNPMVHIRIIPEELTGDEIRGRGEGTLRIASGTTEPLSIHGRYKINEGNYLFTFQSFFKKPFELKKNANNYIEWNGDSYQATVNIDAIYKTDKKVDFSPLTSGGSATTSSSTSFRDFVYVIAKLRGNLFQPSISFELDFPPESMAQKDMAVSFLLNQLQKNENELNKQVAFLVVFNSFAPSGTTSSLAGIDLVVNSISGLLSGQINGVLNNLLSQKLKIPGLYVNFSGSLYNPNPFTTNNPGLGYDRTNLNVNVAKTLFNDRAVLTYEGNFDLPFQSTTQIKTEFLTNFAIEYLINKSGSVRATIFHKENADFLSGNTATGNKSKRFGGSLTYRREFNKLGDFFRKKN